MVRRRPGELLPIELEILDSGLTFTRGGGEFYGFALAAAIADAHGSKRLTAHGTLYKALGRLAEAGLLESRWEDAALAVDEGRPRRRLYRVTGEGELAHARSQRPDPGSASVRLATP